MSKQRVWVSADPGSRGSFCALREDNQAIFLKTTEKPMEILAWFKQLDHEYEVMVVMIENVHAIHGSAAKATFSFGFNAAVVEVIPQTVGLSVDKVNPKKWQKTVGVRSSIKGKHIKTEVASICARLYPKISVHGPRGGLLDGKSDSLMIAHYAKLTYR